MRYKDGHLRIDEAEFVSVPDESDGLFAAGRSLSRSEVEIVNVFDRVHVRHQIGKGRFRRIPNLLNRRHIVPSKNGDDLVFDDRLPVFRLAKDLDVETRKFRRFQRQLVTQSRIPRAETIVSFVKILDRN